MIDSIFINGTVGAGKSTVADALGALEELRGHPHAVIDLDHLRRVWPSTAQDRFNHELELQNLAAVVANYRRAGADHFILAGVLEEQSEIARYEQALITERMLLCRLEVDPDVAAVRLTVRHAGNPAELAWHLNRAIELDGILRESRFDQLVLDASAASPEALPLQIAAAAGW